MPLNSIPPTTTVPNLNKKLEAAQKQCWVDVRFIGGAVSDNAEHLQPLLEAGVCGFKCFLIHSGVDEFTHVSPDQARLALQKLQGSGSFLMFHAELDESHEHEIAQLDPKDYQTFLKSRPMSMENRAIELVANLCRESKVQCHIVHLSSSEAIPIVEKAKADGAPLSVETCYHYLFFNAETIPSAQPQFKCCPPIRENDNREKLWDALKRGTIDFVVSDHSPCTEDLKKKNGGDYMQSWGGISSLQFGLSVLHTEGVVQRGCTWNHLTRWLCEGPAKLIGLGNKKGKIEVGFDADLVIFNPATRWVVEPSMVLHKNKLTAYAGKELIGKVEKTILRGDVIYDAKEGGFKHSEPQGQLILSVTK